MSGTAMVTGLVCTAVAGIGIFYLAGNIGSVTSSEALMVGAEVAVAGVVGGYMASWVNQKFNY